MKNSKLKAFIASFFIVGFFVLPMVVLGQGQPASGPGQPADCQPGQLCNPVPNIKSFTQLIKTILEGFIKIGIPIVALAIIYSGFLFVMARGNSKELETAKRSLMYTLIGAAVLLGSWAIAQLISDTVIELGK